MQAAAELAGLIAVLAVPDDHRAILLKENRGRQTVQQRRPTCQTGPTQVDDQRFGVHRFRQRRQHRCRNAGSRGFGVWTTALEKLDGVPIARKGQGQQAPHQARAQHGETSAHGDEPDRATARAGRSDK